MSVIVGPFARPVPDSAARRPKSAPETRAPATADIPFGDLLAQLGEQPTSTQLQSFAGTGTLGHERGSEKAVASFQPSLAASTQGDSHPLRQPETGSVETLGAWQEAGPRVSTRLEMATALDQGRPPPVSTSAAGRAHMRAEASVVVQAEPEIHAPGAEPVESGQTRTARASREPARAETTRMIGAALDTIDGDLSARVWLPQCAPSERSRLRQAAHAMLAEHGLPDADFNIHEMGGPAVRQKRG